MTVDIRPDHQAIVWQAVREHLPSDVRVWVFGSRAKWTAKAYSDLDLALEGDAAIPAKSLAAFEVALEESTLPFKVDVVDMHAVSDSFRQIIDRDKVALLVAKKQAGGLPEGWREVSLSETLNIVTDKIPAASVTHNNYISTDNMLVDRGGVVAATSLPEIEKFNAYLPDDTLFSNIRTYFKKVWFADRQGGASPDVLIFRTKDRYVLQPRYLYYILSGQEFIDFTVLTAKGAKMPRGDKTAILRHSIALPPLPEQKAIAAILGALDDKIEANRKMNATLEGIARALFKSWFVDFDPVRAKAEDRPSGLPVDLDALFPASFTDSPLGEIPMGWEAGKIEDILERKTIQKRYKKNQVTDNGNIPVFEQGANILLGYHNENPDLNATPDDPAFIFGDHTCVTKLSIEPFSISENVIALKGRLYPTFWVYYAMQGKQEFEEYRRHWMELIVKEVILPPITLCAAFSNIIRCLIIKRTANERQNQTLATLRDTLLPKLISGQIRVKDAEKLVEETV